MLTDSLSSSLASLEVLRRSEKLEATLRYPSTRTAIELGTPGGYVSSHRC